MFRVVVWNAFLVFCGLSLVLALGEVYFRLSVPFLHSTASTDFVPGVGILYQPNSVVRYTNHLDYWTESVANSLGFLAREPQTFQRTEESCHIAVIGDSFVEAKHVQQASRFPVLLEDLMKQSFPRLDVTVSAFGRNGSGQVHQLAFYDRYVQNMHPNILILSFDLNDFYNNSSFLQYLLTPWDPDHPPYYSAQRSKTGEIYLRPPDPDFLSYYAPSPYSPPPPIRSILVSKVHRPDHYSMLAKWFFLKTKLVSLAQSFSFDAATTRRLEEKVESLRRRPQYASLVKDWVPTSNGEISRNLFRDSIELTSFALDQFKQRTDRDGVPLVILSTHRLSSFNNILWKPVDEGTLPIDLLKDMAAAKKIPVIDLGGYVIRRGGRIEELHFAHDFHWNETGHRWAAEAVLEYLERNEPDCEPRPTVRPGL